MLLLLFFLKSLPAQSLQAKKLLIMILLVEIGISFLF